MIRPGSSISKVKTKSNLTLGQMGSKKGAQTMPKWEDFVKKQDWVGAISLLNLEKFSQKSSEILLWLAYCHFHEGDYKKAISIYENVIGKTGKDYDKNLHVYKACCQFALTNYDESKREALKGPESSLQTRLLFNIALKKNDENQMMVCHSKMMDNTHDQLCNAAIQYLRGNYDEAVEIYKRMNIDNREYQALNIYCAICYYKQEYFEISLDMMQNYISTYPNSIVATNLKACNYFQLMQGKNAEEEFKRLEKNYKGGDLYADYDLLRHNLCVFRSGENALQVLPPLIDLFPEAKLNLVIYYLKNDEVEEAHKITADIEPVSPREYMLKGIVMAIMGQKANNREQVTQAQQLFQMIGTSATECDTIPGRQCASSYLFLKKQFDSVSIYLKTIKEYLAKDDDFNWNYGIACANVKQWKEAEEALTAIENEKYKSDFVYICWLARAYVMNGEPNSAWQLYLDMDTSNDSLILMNQIANDCYRKGFFVISLKAFDMLCRLDSENEQNHFQGKLGAATGVFQMVITRKATAEQFEDMLSILKNTTGIDKDPAIDQILKTIRTWC